MPEWKELELARSADVLVRKIFDLKPGENFLVTVDSRGDWRVAEATARAAAAIGAKVALVYWQAPPVLGGKGTDPYTPDPAKAAIVNCDAWCELNGAFLPYSSPYEEMIKKGRCRAYGINGADADMMWRCIGSVDYDTLGKFQNILHEMTRKAKEVKVTSKAGTNVKFNNDPTRPYSSEVFARTPGAHYLAGQIAWIPIEDTMNGTIVCDGPLGMGTSHQVPKYPVTLTFEKGRIVKVEGKEDAKAFEQWLASFKNPSVYNIAHVCWGCLPGADLTGRVSEVERIWGCITWGFGYQPIPLKGARGTAPAHTDGVSLSMSVRLDNEVLLEDGRYVHPDLSPLEKKLITH